MKKPKSVQKIFFFFLAVALVLGLVSCEPAPVQLLPKEKLFRISLGTLEDELDLFVREGQPSSEKNRMVFYDGLAFVSNGNAKKVMEFSSYGDLVSLHYNSTTNPQPVVLGLPSSDSQIKNRKAIPYEFNSPGELAVTKGKMLLVEDRISPERRILDEKRQALQDRIVLRFDREGKFLDYLGQEGIGGTPFPYIDKVIATQSDEIVVVSRTIQSWLIYWFSLDGKPLYQASLDYAQLPIPDGKKREDIFASLETIFPDWDSHNLYLKISYYEKSIDPTTRTESGVGIYQSRIFFYNVESQQFTGSFVMPRLTKKKTSAGLFDEQSSEFPYEFLGTVQGEKFYFMSAADEGNHRFIIVDKQGKVIVEKNIVLDEENLQFSHFYVTPKGVLAGMLSDGTDVEISWWRADKLLFPYVQAPM